MTKIIWDELTDISIESSLDRGVLYPKNLPGVSWSGLLNVVENPSSGSEELYFEGIKIADLTSQEACSFEIDAITYPDEFAENQFFGLSYRTETSLGYQIHLIYNAILSPNNHIYNSDDDEKHPLTFSWNISTVPIKILGLAPFSQLIIESHLVDSNKLEFIEEQLYGTSVLDPYLPNPALIIEILGVTEFAVVDHGDGTWSACGPDSAIQMLDSTTFEINHSSAVYLDGVSYTLTSV